MGVPFLDSTQTITIRLIFNRVVHGLVGGEPTAMIQVVVQAAHVIGVVERANRKFKTIMELGQMVVSEMNFITKVADSVVEPE